MILRDRTVFIVEDNTQNRVVYQMTLIVNGARVEFERWGRDALGRLNSVRHVDLIILDLMLHNGVSGYDIFDEIRALPEYNCVPIIAVSAAEPAIAIPKTQVKGFDGFIAKPIDSDEFPDQIARVIAGEKIWYAGERYQGSVK
jgi:two-component system, cell cycle response regulator DivK